MNTNNRKQLKKGIGLILVSAAMTCCGQLSWKFGMIHSENIIIYYLLGFLLYGAGALFMLIAFKFGEMSILHPMLSMGFVGSLFLGNVFLKEEISITKIIGIVLILAGVCLLSYQRKTKEEEGSL